MIILPEMVVEKRESKTAHGLNPPTLDGDVGYDTQLIHTLDLVEFAKTSFGFPIEILKIYDPFSSRRNGYSNSLTKFGYTNWRNCVEFVKDDECNEFFVAVARWAKSNNIPLKKDISEKGFIGGTGIGIHKLYMDVCQYCLEKAFDAKYYFYKEYDTKRPIERLNDRLGFVCSALFNYMHPGHPRYPAGHGVKFFSACVTALMIWDINDDQRSDLMTAAYVLSMARSGGGVHLPEDNLGGGYLCAIKEFKSMGDEIEFQKTIDMLNEIRRFWILSS